MRAVKALQERVFAENRIEPVWNSIVTEINGDEIVRSVNIFDKVKNISHVQPTDGVFVAIGTDPNTDFLKDQLEMENGWIKADENCETSVKGVFAAGDVRTKALRQVVTGVADGAIAVYFAERYL